MNNIRTIGKSPFGTLKLVLCLEVISTVSFIYTNKIFQ